MQKKSLFISILLHASALLAVATISYNVMVPKGSVTVTELEIPASQGSPNSQVNTPPEPIVKVPTESQPIEEPKPVKPQPVVEKHAAEKHSAEPPVVEKVEESELPKVDEPKKVVSQENLPEELPKETVDDATPAIAPTASTVTAEQPSQPNQPPPAAETSKPLAQPLTPPLGQANGSPQVPPSAGSEPHLGDPNAQAHSYTELTPMPGNPKPDYPFLAKFKKLQADVLINFTVKSDGRVGEIQVLKNTGDASFAKSVVEAHQKNRYKAGRVGIYQQLYQFRLTGEAQEMPSQLRRGK